ncbi:HlyD family type I secretion periplasmic adaptor subunit [Sphingomonas parva]|uniref:Membrane fusion protein (MFP) family protein n=2 Tax=Sphingomonas parva TaxID=2555898 RepID=A0A4Y8ZU79_9SPHN|nr:HlyD family type I secretion periplasmic adaptor subunit [Sphingomonas parva]
MRHLEDYADRLRPRTASNILLWAILAFVLIFVIWAAFTELDRTVRGSGRVIASSQLQTVSNLEGGVVEAILVRTGQQVKAGQELIRLDQTQTGSELGSGEASANALAVKIARLQAEVAGREPAYPPARDAVTQNQITIERALHASRMAELASVVNAGNARIQQAQRAVQEAEATYAARVAARDARAGEVRILRPLVERGIEPRLSLMQAESNYAVAQSEASASAATISRARAAVSEAVSALNQQRQDWRALAGNELATAQAELSARRSTLPALAERVARTTVKAPLPGRVNRVLVTTVGAAVAPGAPLVEIVPSEESLLVEAHVRPQDIAFVKIGQKAKVDITAYDPSVYGSLSGVVVAISPDAVLNERTGETFYTVQVRTTANALKDRSGRSLPIGTGMVSNVSLLGDKRTVLQYILTPITRLTETAFRE